MKSKKLAELCALWQSRLRLQDWSVRVRFVERGGLDISGGGEGYGRIDWSLHAKTADISIVQSEYLAQNDPNYDIEKALVHELLHLHFTWLGGEPGTIEDDLFEQMLWAMENALVNAYRLGVVEDE